MLIVHCYYNYIVWLYIFPVTFTFFQLFLLLILSIISFIMKPAKMQFGVYSVKIKTFQVVQFPTSIFVVLFPFFFLYQERCCYQKSSFLAFIFNPDTCELTLCQCECLSQALPRSVSPHSCFCLFLHPWPSFSPSMFSQKHSLRHILRDLEETRVYPQDSEAALGQGKDKTPLFAGDFGTLDHFIPKRIKSVSWFNLELTDPAVAQEMARSWRLCQALPGRLCLWMGLTLAFICNVEIIPSVQLRLVRSLK